MSGAKQCPNCDSWRVGEREIVDCFPYGTGPYPVTLRVVCPLLVCTDCDQSWTDERGERAREQAIKLHLARTGSGA